MARKNYFHYAGATVLGMHDALVSLTGLIAGLTFALADRYTIILTSIIASITASLSMGASNYLAMRANGVPHPITAALYTGTAYTVTCVALIMPFFILSDIFTAMWLSMLIAIIIIFLFNFILGRIQHRPFIKNFIEMLVVCTIVSVVAFGIGWCANVFLGINA